MIQFMIFLLMMEFGTSFGFAGILKSLTNFKSFSKLDSLYVADGHHRIAAAARVGRKFQENNPSHTGDEEYNFFMAVLFPDDQLKIFDYNRVVKDLNGHSQETFEDFIE